MPPKVAAIKRNVSKVKKKAEESNEQRIAKFFKLANDEPTQAAPRASLHLGKAIPLSNIPSTSKSLSKAFIKSKSSQNLIASSNEKSIVKQSVSPNHSDLEEFAEEATVDVMDIRIRDKLDVSKEQENIRNFVEQNIDPALMGDLISDDECDNNVENGECSQGKSDPMDDCAKRMSEETSGLNDLDISSLNIKTNYFCVDKMCKMEKVGLIYDEFDLKSIGDVKLSLMELYFLLHPCCTFRVNILLILNNCLADGKKLTQLTYKDVISIFYFICQFDEKDDSLYKFSMFDKLYLISRRLLKAEGSADVGAESLSVKTCQQFSQQMCLDNLNVFCSLFDLLNFGKWRPKDVCLFLETLCRVYLDATAWCRRSTIANAINTLFVSLEDAFASSVLKLLAKKLTKIDEDPRGILQIFILFSRFQVFEPYRLHFVKEVFLNMLAKYEANDDGQAELAGHETVAEISESTPEIVIVFSLLPRIGRALIPHPTSMYTIMQMIDECVTEEVMARESLSTLDMLISYRKAMQGFAKCMSPIDDIVANSMSTACHRMELMAQCRRINAFEKENKMKEKKGIDIAILSAPSSDDDD